MQKLASDYPTFVTLTTTQEWFGVPRAGECYILLLINMNMLSEILVYVMFFIYLFWYGLLDNLFVYNLCMLERMGSRLLAHFAH